MSTYNLSADAPEFVPGFARGVHSSSSAGAEFIPAAAAALAPVVESEASLCARRDLADAAKTLTIDTKTLAGDRKRTLTMRPMAEARMEKLKQPFDNIGTVYHGYDHSPEADSVDEDEAAVGCHDNDYRIKKIQRSIIGVADKDVGDFPKNIQEYYWINDGKNDEHPWYALGQLNNGVYFYFAASCTFSGFDCSGNMVLYAADNLQTLYDHGMDGAARLRFASCFDKGTREKLKADAAAAYAVRQKAVQAQKKASAERAAAWQARKAVAARTGTPAQAAAGGGAGRIARGPPVSKK